MKNYSLCSKDEIKKDIIFCKQLVEDTLKECKINIDKLINNKYYEKTNNDFKLLIKECAKALTTFNDDIKEVLQNYDNIGIKSIKLLENIGNIASKYNEDLGIEFHAKCPYDIEDGYNTLEEIYNQLRDVFFDLECMNDMSLRLKDYIESKENVSININNSNVNIGKNNKISINEDIDNAINRIEDICRKNNITN